MNLSYNTIYKYIDKGVLELVGPFGIVNCIRQLMLPQHILQTGLIYHYSGLLCIMLIVLVHTVLDFHHYMCHDIY